MFDYADRQRDLRSAEPQDDVIGALTVAQSEGVLNEQEFHNYFGVLMIAGNETTRHTISHGMLALMEHPEQLKLLQEEPERIRERPRRSCGGRRRCTTSGGPRAATSSSVARRSSAATRS